MSNPATPDDGPQSGPEMELGNEYAVVVVRRVETGKGARLEIASPRLGTSIRLDPVELEALTWQSHELFSKLLRTPFGPERDE